MLRTTPPPRIAEILEREGAATGPPPPGLGREILRDLVAMGLPSMASFLLLTLYDLIDVFWLARVGEEAVAAVTAFSALMWVLAFANGIVGAGSVAVISRRWGARDLAGTEQAVKDTFVAKAIVGTAFGLPGILVTPSALALMGAAPDVVALGTRYGILQCAVLPVALVSFSVYTAFRGIGRPATGMWISAAGAAVNLVLDPLLIFGPGPFPRLGVLGASIASALGFVTVTAWGLVALGSARSPVTVRWLSGPRPSPANMLAMARVGAPMGAASLSMALFGTVLVKLVAIYGTGTVALFGMSQKILRFGHTILAGLGLGSGALIGQYLGAGRPRRAWVCAVLTMHAGAAALAVFAAAVALLAEPIVALFFDDPALARPGVLYLRILAAGLPFAGYLGGCEHAYGGAGRNLPPMLLLVTHAWIVTVPLMLLLGRGLALGPPGMMAGVSGGQAVGALLGVWLLRRGTWLTHRI